MIALALCTALAAQLDELRVFVGDGHARVLLVGDGALSGVTIRSTPPVGSAPARVILTVPSTRLSPTLRDAYLSEAGRWLVPVGRGGVEQVAIAELGGSLQVAVELEHARETKLMAIGDEAVLVDLRRPSVEPDRSLPDPQVLGAWLSGVSLARQAERGSDPRPRIVVDPGHGGWDIGAKGLTGTHEADIALGIARRLARELELRLDAEVYLTREDDTFIELRDRAAMANALGADLFVSVHANAAPGPTAWGIETYYLSDASDSRAQDVAARENATAGDVQLAESLLENLAMTGTHQLSRALATGVQQSTVEQLREVYGSDQIRDLGVKTARFYVLVFTRMPAILYEASFLTNDGDEMRLRQPLFQQTTAEAIATAVEAHLEASR